MRIAEMNWGQVEAYLRRDDRCAVPLGSVEQHANLSLAVDTILSERVATEAAEPLGVPVFPVVAYGITPYFLAYPGTVSLRVSTYVALVARRARQPAPGRLPPHPAGQRPRRQPARAARSRIEWMADHPADAVRFHNWWNAPKTLAKVQEIDRVASHASWMENFPWTRLPGVVQPSQRKPMIDIERLRLLEPGDGPRLSRRRQFRRLLRAAGRGHAGDLGGRGRGDPRRCSRGLGVSGPILVWGAGAIGGTHRRRSGPRRPRRAVRRPRRGARRGHERARPRDRGPDRALPRPGRRPACRSRSRGRSRPILLCVKAQHTEAATQGAAAAPRRRRLRRLGPERPQRAGHRRHRRPRARRSAASSISAPTTWSRASSRTAAAAPSCSASWTAAITPRLGAAARAVPRVRAGRGHHRQHLGLSLGQAGLRRAAVRDRADQRLDRRRAGRRPLPPDAGRARPRGGARRGRGGGAARGVQRLRPGRLPAGRRGRGARRARSTTWWRSTAARRSRTAASGATSRSASARPRSTRSSPRSCRSAAGTGSTPLTRPARRADPRYRAGRGGPGYGDSLERPGRGAADERQPSPAAPRSSPAPATASAAPSPTPSPRAGRGGLGLRRQRGRPRGDGRHGARPLRGPRRRRQRPSRRSRPASRRPRGDRGRRRPGQQRRRRARPGRAAGRGGAGGRLAGDPRRQPHRRVPHAPRRWCPA